MADLPKISEQTLRVHALRWKNLIEKLGFTGGHLNWHKSQKIRHELARPSYSLAPPPPRYITSRGPHHEVTHIGRQGKPVSYDEWLKIQHEDWVARESDPKVVDSIAIAETVHLAKGRFEEIVGDYLSAWLSQAVVDSDQFAESLDVLRQLVISEVGSLWNREWHAGWFERACRAKVGEELAPLLKEWSSKARNLELERLQNQNGPDSRNLDRPVRDWQGLRKITRLTVSDVGGPLSNSENEAFEQFQAALHVGREDKAAPREPQVATPPAKGQGGRPVKDESRRANEAWINADKPALDKNNKEFFDRLASELYPNEFKVSKEGSQKRNRLRQRIMQAIRREQSRVKVQVS